MKIVGLSNTMNSIKSSKVELNHRVKINNKLLRYETNKKNKHEKRKK